MARTLQADFTQRDSEDFHGIKNQEINVSHPRHSLAASFLHVGDCLPVLVATFLSIDFNAVAPS